LGIVRLISKEVLDTPVITDGMEAWRLIGCCGGGIIEGSLLALLSELPDEGNLGGVLLGGRTENSLGMNLLTAGGMGPGGAGIHP
jgi:small ligand-binding sensory domain FIST